MGIKYFYERPAVAAFGGRLSGLLKVKEMDTGEPTTYYTEENQAKVYVAGSRRIGEGHLGTLVSTGGGSRRGAVALNLRGRRAACGGVTCFGGVNSYSYSYRRP